MSRRPHPKDRDTNPALGARVRQLSGESWKVVKQLIAQGKVFVDGEPVREAGYRPRPGQEIEIRHSTKGQTARAQQGPRVDIVFQDKNLVVIDKPSGISSVPYEESERNTAMDLIRKAWRARKEPATGALFVVHRIDKDTSGLLIFARSKKAEIGLARQLRDHSMEREYLCVVNGAVESQRIESVLIRNRGDGLRGSNRHDDKGKRAVTHVQKLRSLPGATLCAVRLETGRTHQIRVHLSEAGHPLVGERVYDRDMRNQGVELVESPRLLLHAASLGFEHPITGERVSLRREPPPDFQAVVDEIESSAPNPS